MKVRLKTDVYGNEDQYEAQAQGGPRASSRSMILALDWPGSREPVVGEYIYLGFGSLRVEAVFWLPAQRICFLKLSDAVGRRAERGLKAAGFR